MFSSFESDRGVGRLGNGRSGHLLAVPRAAVHVDHPGRSAGIVQSVGDAEPCALVMPYFLLVAHASTGGGFVRCRGFVDCGWAGDERRGEECVQIAGGLDRAFLRVVGHADLWANVYEAEDMELVSRALDSAFVVLVSRHVFGRICGDGVNGWSCRIDARGCHWILHGCYLCVL